MLLLRASSSVVSAAFPSRSKALVPTHARVSGIAPLAPWPRLQAARGVRGGQPEARRGNRASTLREIPTGKKVVRGRNERRSASSLPSSRREEGAA